jgi:hypothetical protein
MWLRCVFAIISQMHRMRWIRTSEKTWLRSYVKRKPEENPFTY